MKEDEEEEVPRAGDGVQQGTARGGVAEEDEGEREVEVGAGEGGWEQGRACTWMWEWKPG